MVAKRGVNMTIGAGINKQGTLWILSKMESSVSFREKMEDAIYVGGITDMAEFQFEVKIVTDTICFQRECLAIGQMVYYGLYSGKIKWWVKQFHSMDLKDINIDKSF